MFLAWPPGGSVLSLAIELACWTVTPCLSVGPSPFAKPDSASLKKRLAGASRTLLVVSGSESCIHAIGHEAKNTFRFAYWLDVRNEPIRSTGREIHLTEALV